MTIRLVTDSTADLPSEWLERFHIGVAPLHVTDDDGQARGTAATTPEEFGELYSEMLDDPECTGIVSVHISARLSRTWQSAADAATRFGGHVLVVDSLGAGMALGAAVAQCAWEAENGLGLSATFDLANRLCRSATTLIAVESLDSLRRGGRIGAAVALFGGALAMKPIFELRAGVLGLAAKTRTTGKAHQRVRALLRDEFSRGDVLVAVHHSGDAAKAQELAEEIRRETSFPERVVVVRFDPVLAWHLGPGTVAVTVSDLVSPGFPIPHGDPQIHP